MGDQVLRLLRKRDTGTDEVVGFAGVGDEVVGLDGLREVVDGDHLPADGNSSDPAAVRRDSEAETTNVQTCIAFIGTLLSLFGRKSTKQTLQLPYKYLTKL